MEVHLSSSLQTFVSTFFIFIGKNNNLRIRETMKQVVVSAHAYHFTYHHVSSRQRVISSFFFFFVVSSVSLKQDTQISFTHCLWVGHHKTATQLSA